MTAGTGLAILTARIYPQTAACPIYAYLRYRSLATLLANERQVR